MMDKWRPLYRPRSIQQLYTLYLGCILCVGYPGTIRLDGCWLCKCDLWSLQFASTLPSILLPHNSTKWLGGLEHCHWSLHWAAASRNNAHINGATPKVWSCLLLVFYSHHAYFLCCIFSPIKGQQDQPPNGTLKPPTSTVHCTAKRHFCKLSNLGKIIWFDIYSPKEHLWPLEKGLSVFIPSFIF